MTARRGSPTAARAAVLALTGLALACLAFAGLSGCALDMKYGKYAIVYGVANYQAGVSDLTYPDDDAAAMVSLLTSQGFQVWTETDAGATRNNLETLDVPAVAAAAQEDDLFVFYFSGHGGQGPAGAENSGGDGQDEYIYLYGSDWTVTGLPLTFSDDQLVDAFVDIKARKKVIILDSCNSGGFVGNALEADGKPPSLTAGSEGLGTLLARAIRLYANFDGSSADIPPWKALVISAAGERELSYEMGAPFNHGIFTYYLLEAAERGDRNGDGFVTVTEAFAHSQERVYRYWNLYYGYPTLQFSPHVSGGPVDYVLFEAR